jgi:hypothetical protein
LAPDTPKNQKAFPQSAQQQPGCGFPLIKLVALFSLSSGALLPGVWTFSSGLAAPDDVETGASGTDLPPGPHALGR